jgi:hypothetical protein
VREILNRHKFVQPFNDDFFDVRFPDGSQVEFDAKGLSGSTQFTGCSFAIRSLTDSVTGFTFDVVKEGNMVFSLRWKVAFAFWWTHHRGRTCQPI